MTAYVRAAGELRTPARRVLAAQLLTASAQNVAILLDRLGEDRLPGAFPDGRVR
jgi:hypothetical protein